MQLARLIVCVLILEVSVLTPRSSAETPPSTHRIVIAASAVLDGKGSTLRDVRIAIEGSKIVAIIPNGEGPVDYDLRGLTVLPGWIDAHVHITWIFGKDGKNAGTVGTAQEDAQSGLECMADGRLYHRAKCGSAKRYSSSRCQCKKIIPGAAHFDGGRTVRSGE